MSSDDAGNRPADNASSAALAVQPQAGESGAALNHRQRQKLKRIEEVAARQALLATGSMFFSRLLPSVPLYKWGGFVQIFPLKSGGVLEPPPPLEWAGFGRLSLRGKTPPL